MKNKIEGGELVTKEFLKLKHFNIEKVATPFLLGKDILTRYPDLLDVNEMEFLMTVCMYSLVDIDEEGCSYSLTTETINDILPKLNTRVKFNITDIIDMRRCNEEEWSDMTKLLYLVREGQPNLQTILRRYYNGLGGFKSLLNNLKSEYGLLGYHSWSQLQLKVFSNDIESLGKVIENLTLTSLKQAIKSLL